MQANICSVKPPMRYVTAHSSSLLSPFKVQTSFTQQFEIFAVQFIIFRLCPEQFSVYCSRYIVGHVY